MSTTTLPTIDLYRGKDRDVRLTRSTGTLDWTTWTRVTLYSAGLALTLSSASAAQLVVEDANSILLHFLAAHTSAVTTVARYGYQISVYDGVKTHVLPLGEGEIVVHPIP